MEHRAAPISIEVKIILFWFLAGWSNKYRSFLIFYGFSLFRIHSRNFRTPCIYVPSVSVRTEKLDRENDKTRRRIISRPMEVGFCFGFYTVRPTNLLLRDKFAGTAKRLWSQHFQWQVNALINPGNETNGLYFFFTTLNILRVDEYRTGSTWVTRINNER